MGSGILCRQRRGLRHRHIDAGSDERDQLSPIQSYKIVVVHLVVEATVPFSFRAGHAADLQRRYVRKDNV